MILLAKKILLKGVAYYYYNRKIIENFGRKHNEKKVKYISSEKFNKIEQKIKGRKSGLNIYRGKEESKLNENSNNNSYNFKENEYEFT